MKRVTTVQAVLVVIMTTLMVLPASAGEAEPGVPTVVDEIRHRLESVVVTPGPVRIEPNIDCGIHAMAAIELAMGREVDWSVLQRELAPQRTGSSLAQVQAYAEGRGLHAVAVELSSADLPRLRYPAVLHVRKGGKPSAGPNHFLVTLPSSVDGVVAFDPPEHLQVITPESLDPVWQGYALVIADEPITAGDILEPIVPVRQATAGLAGAGLSAAGLMLAVSVRRRRLA